MVNFDTYGSEGDAYRYTKKVLQTLPNSGLIESIYKEVAEKRGISSWTRAAYMDLRATFFRDGQCKIRFAPGAARIAFGELELGTGDEELVKVSNFRDMLRIISIAHCKDYNRHLVSTHGDQLTYEKMLAIYGTKATSNWAAMKRKLKRMKYGERRYRIIELDSFETAKQYAEYTNPHTWCHLQYPDTFKHYQMVKSSSLDKDSDSSATNRIRLYLAVLPGFEKITVDDELYGESMLGIDIGPGGRLIHVNNRWNHAHDNIDERKGDNKYSEIELSMLLGGPFFEVCPPYTAKDERKLLKDMAKDIVATNENLLRQRIKFAKLTQKSYGKVGIRTKKFVDHRDQSTYHLKKFGKSLWTTEPLKYVPEGYDVVKLPANVLDILPKETFDVPVKIITVIHTDEGAKLVWKRCDDPALECYRDMVIRHDIHRIKENFIKHIECGNTKAMILPCCNNRMIVRNHGLKISDILRSRSMDIKSNFSLDALKLVYNVYVPLVEVNDKIFALHPGYNSIVEKMENGVKFPEMTDDLQQKTEVVCIEEVSDDMEPSYTTTERPGAAQTQSFGRGQNMTEYWRRMQVRERFVNDSIFGAISVEMADANFTVDDIIKVRSKLGKIIQRTSNKILSNNDSNKWVIRDDYTTDDIETPVDFSEVYNTQFDDTVVRNNSTDDRLGAYDMLYSAMLSADETEFRRTQKLGNLMYRGYVEGSIRPKPAYGLLYLDINSLSDIIANDLQIPYNLTPGLISAVDVCNSVPVAVPGVSGYVYAPSFEMSKTPVTEYEATLFNLGCDDPLKEGEHRPIIQFDNGVSFYPADARPLLESEELRFPRLEDMFSFMAANGFALDGINDDLKKPNMLMSKDEFDTINEFVERYRNRLTGQVTTNDEPGSTKTQKKKRVGGAVNIPKKLRPEYGVPPVFKSIHKAEKFGELFVLGSCMPFEKPYLTRTQEGYVDLGMADMISRLGLRKVGCFCKDEGVRLSMNVTNLKTGTDGHSPAQENSPVKLTTCALNVTDRMSSYIISLDYGKVDYMIPFMVKNE